MKKTSQVWLLAGLGAYAALTLHAHAEGLLAIDNPAKNNLGNGTYAHVEAFQGNDSVAIRHYGNDWQGNFSPRSGTNIGVLAARSEIGGQWNGFQLGALHRAQALVEANRDTTDLAQQYSSNAGYSQGRTYLLDYHIQGFEADGVRLSKRMQWRLSDQWHLDGGAGVSMLQGKQIKLETVSGQVIALNTQDFNANATQDTVSSTMDTSGNGNFNTPFGAHPTLSGQGFAADIGFVLERIDGLRLEAAVNDLAGSIAWKNVPRYTSDYNTATKYFDANGYVRFNPAVTSQSSYGNVEQTLDPKLWLAASYPLGPVEAKAATSYLRGYWFTQLGLGHRVSPHCVVEADYDLRFQTVRLAVQYHYAYLGVRTDNANLDQAKAYGLTFGLNIPF
jgi:hypothetical protein